MFASEDYVTIENDGKSYGNGESGVYETFTDNVGRLFLAFQREHGRCLGNVYIDNADGEARKVGWVFEKRRKYSDCNETFIAQTWVTLHDSMPVKTIAYDYHTL